MENPKRYSEKIKREDKYKGLGLQMPEGTPGILDSTLFIKPLFQPPFKSLPSSGRSEVITSGLQVSNPQDASEIQADEMALAFMDDDAAQFDDIFSEPVNEISQVHEEDVLEPVETVDDQLQNSQGSGLLLDQEIKGEIEESTGIDLPEINIHTDEEANDHNENLNAEAFTYGNDIYFRAGKYNPQSEEGRQLLAHELVHVVQGQFLNDDIIHRDSVNDANSSITFTIDISGYVPDADKVKNEQKSSAYVLSKIFSITPAEAADKLKFTLTRGGVTIGYTQADVDSVTKDVTLANSTYFLALDRIKNVSKGTTAIDNLAAAIDQSYRRSKPGVFSYATDYPILVEELRAIYRILFSFNDADIVSLKENYQVQYEMDLSWALIVIEGAIDAEFTNKKYAGDHKNCKLLIEAIQGMIYSEGTQPLLLDDPEQPVNEKPKGRIITTTGSKVVTTGYQSSYVLYIDKNNQHTYQYDWYVLYDALYPSDKRAHISHSLATENFSYTWDGAGYHKIICNVTMLLGELPVQSNVYSTVQYVYPNVHEFTSTQKEGDLDNQALSNIFSDVQQYETNAVGLRLKYMKELMPRYPEFISTYSDADIAATTISDKVRDLNKTYVRNDFYEKEETRKYEKEEGLDSPLPPDQNITDVVSGIQGMIPDSVQQTLNGKIDVAAIKKQIKAFYDALTDRGYEDDYWGHIHRNWWDEHVYYSKPFLKSKEIDQLPNDITLSNVGKWSELLTGLREVLGRLDEFFVEALKYSGRTEESDEMKMAGSMGLSMADVYENHPDAITIPAIFYPDSQALSIDTVSKTDSASEATPENYNANGYRVFFYLYQGDDNNWILREAGSGKYNEIERGDGEGVLNDIAKIEELFAKLDSKLRFPKGVLEYRFPITDTGNQTVSYVTKTLITTEPTSLSEWLLGIGMAVGLIALTLATLGAGAVVITPVVMLSSGLMIAGNIQSMIEKDEQGMLTESEVAINLMYIASDLMAGLAAGAKILSIAATEGSTLARFSGKAFIALEKYSLIAGKVSLMIAGKDIFDQLSHISEIKDDKERHAAYMRILGHLLVIGVLHITSNKFNWKFEAQWKMRHPKTTGMIEVGKYKYSQATAGKDLSEGNISVNDLTTEMKTNGWDFTKAPPKIVDMGNGEFITLDHRRLIAAKNAGLTEHPCQTVSGNSAIAAEDVGRFNMRDDLKANTYTEVEGLIGRKVDKKNPLSLEPVNYREAAIFRCANQRSSSRYKNFPLTGSSQVPTLR